MIGKRLVVRILLEGGTYLDIPMVEVEAFSFVKNWKPKPNGEWERVATAGGMIAFDPKRVQGMHTYDPEELQRQQAAMLAAQQGTRSQQPMNRPRDLGSGNN